MDTNTTKNKPSLLTQNKYLKNSAIRRKMTLISVYNSCLIEGVSCPELKSEILKLKDKR